MEVQTKYSNYETSDLDVLPSLVSYLEKSFGLPASVDGPVQIFDFMNDSEFASLGAWGSVNEIQPRAFLNYIVFDDKFEFQKFGIEQVGLEAEIPSDATAALAHKHQKLTLDVTIEKQGYIYVYLSVDDRQNMDVYFDDFKITHHLNDVVAGSDFMPFGLTMSNRVITRESYAYKYQGQFAQHDEETGWSHFTLREWDPVIGRWLRVDPMRQFYSPYVGMGNNPIIGIDPTGGDCPKCPKDAKYDEYRNNRALFGYDPDIGVYSDFGRVGTSGTWNWFNELIYRLNTDGGGGIAFMNSKGLGGEPIYELRKGVASNIELDPTFGIVVFKTPNRMLRLDTRKNLSQSELKKLGELLGDAKYLFELGHTGASVVENIMKNVTEANGQVHLNLVVTDDEGYVRTDSVFKGTVLGPDGVLLNKSWQRFEKGSSRYSTVKYQRVNK